MLHEGMLLELPGLWRGWHADLEHHVLAVESSPQHHVPAAGRRLLGGCPRPHVLVVLQAAARQVGGGRTAATAVHALQHRVTTDIDQLASKERTRLLSVSLVLLVCLTDRPEDDGQLQGQLGGHGVREARRLANELALGVAQRPHRTTSLLHARLAAGKQSDIDSTSRHRQRGTE